MGKKSKKARKYIMEDADYVVMCQCDEGGMAVKHSVSYKELTIVVNHGKKNILYAVVKTFDLLDALSALENNANLSVDVPTISATGNAKTLTIYRDQFSAGETLITLTINTKKKNKGVINGVVVAEEDLRKKELDFVLAKLVLQGENIDKLLSDL